MTCMGWRNRATWAVGSWLSTNREVLEEVLLRINAAERGGRAIAAREVVVEWFTEAADALSAGDCGELLLLSLSRTGLANVDWEELVGYLDRMADGEIEEDEGDY